MSNKAAGSDVVYQTESYSIRILKLAWGDVHVVDGPGAPIGGFKDLLVATIVCDALEAAYTAGRLLEAKKH